MSRLEKLAARRTVSKNPTDFSSQELMESYNNLKKSDGIKYAIGAMQPISAEYTKNTFKQGDRVKSQLSDNGLSSHEFEYQGSVTNNTHIKALSDIDLLVITPRFVRLETPQQPSSPFDGNPSQVMRELRSNIENQLVTSFPAAKVDKSGSKSVTIEGGSLTRKVDVVPANWFNSNEYIRRNHEKIYRGIQVFDKNNASFITNFPFIHNLAIEQKDNKVNGGLRRAIRLMKSLMYDNSLNISSYDISGIAYNIPDGELSYGPPFELRIISSCIDYCQALETNSFLRNSIKVPNGTRFVFESKGGATFQELQNLLKELFALEKEILNENVSSFTKISNAKIEYKLLENSIL